MNQQVMRRLPNIFTFLRLILIPVFVLLMLDPSILMLRAALVVFMLAAFTDYLDGRIARKYGAVTDFGKLLDPIADKILVMAALIMIMGLGPDESGENLLPAWLVVMILARETWVNGLRSMAAAKGVVVAASKIGKLKSAIQMLAIVLMLMQDWPIEIGEWSIPCPYIGIRLLVVSVVISYWGAIEYSILLLGKETGLLNKTDNQ
ncbi:MAG: CDP-diacylglycerol--glycerol-3-phosphate 3-phosphatidyltransferase [Bdellovibrionota bacterium]|jgi:CDP-diacylglycerol--glycerol-3-phosphate 3-phosphatidyltransferase